MSRRKKLIPIFLAFAMLLSLNTSMVFATQKDKPDLTKEHIFYSQTKDFKYKPDKEIEENGKKYKLEDVKYIVLAKKGAETKTVELKNLKDKKAPNRHEVTIDGKKVYYILNPTKTTYEPARKEAIYVYEGENPFNFSPETEKTLTDQMGKEFTGLLSNTVKGNPYLVQQAVPGRFVGDEGSQYFYFANTGSMWKVDTKSPNWQGYETDILNYLGLPTNIYTITGGKWTGENTSNGLTTRTASFSATKKVADYTCTYSLGDGDADKFNAKAVYESPYKVMAIAEYNSNFLTKAIVVGAVILIGAIALATLLFFLAKKRKEDEEK